MMAGDPHFEERIVLSSTGRFVDFHHLAQRTLIVLTAILSLGACPACAQSAPPPAEKSFEKPVATLPAIPGKFTDTTAASGIRFTAVDDPTPVGTIPEKRSSKDWNRLYHQLKDGTFEDVTEKSGLKGIGYGMGVAVGDFDNDGFEDLYVTAYGSNRLYHNDGDGSFTDITAKSGLATPGKGLGIAIAIADFDRDGKIDIAIANDSMPEYLYRNKGDGTFEETGLAAEIAVDGDGRTYAGMGIDFQDFDNDGLPDLVITNLANQKYALYRNNGDGSFTYDTYMAGLGPMTQLHSGWGIRFLDYDNDGFKDLLIAQGHDLDTVQLNFPHLRYKEPMLLARNMGNGTFADVSAGSGSVFAQAWVGRGMAVGDLDNDGRIDAVVTTNGGPAYLLHNETPTQNHWLSLLLVGHKSNRDAIGAEIKLVTSHGAQYWTVSTAGSYLSSNDKRAYFGLGKDLAASTIEIRWPSGIRQTVNNVTGDRIVKIDEPSHQ